MIEFAYHFYEKGGKAVREIEHESVNLELKTDVGEVALFTLEGAIISYSHFLSRYLSNENNFIFRLNFKKKHPY